MEQAAEIVPAEAIFQELMADLRRAGPRRHECACPKGPKLRKPDELTGEGFERHVHPRNACRPSNRPPWLSLRIRPFFSWRSSTAAEVEAPIRRSRLRPGS